MIFGQRYFDIANTQIVILLQPLVDVIAFETKTEPAVESLEDDVASLVNIASAMTIRPIPLQNRKHSAKQRSVYADSEFSHVISSNRSTSRPGSARPLARMLEHKSLHDYSTLSRAPSAAASKIQNLKRNNGGMRLIPLSQQTSTILNDTLYGTSIVGASRASLSNIASLTRPGTGLAKRLPPLRTSFSDPLDPIVSQRGSRHVLFDALTAGISHEYPFSTAIPARPFSAKRNGFSNNVRAKSARPVVREERVWVLITV